MKIIYKASAVDPSVGHLPTSVKAKQSAKEARQLASNAVQAILEKLMLENRETQPEIEYGNYEAEYLGIRLFFLRYNGSFVAVHISANSGLFKMK